MEGKMDVITLAIENNNHNNKSPNITINEGKGDLDFFQVVVACVLTIIIITGNTLVLVVTPRMSRLHKTVAYFMAQLAVADILVGLCMPLHMAMVLYRPMLENINVCVLRYTTMGFTECASLGCLLVMSIDCFVKMYYPLHYPVWMTRRCCVGLTIAVWGFALAVGFLLPTFWHNDWADIPKMDCDLVLVFKAEVIFIGMGYFCVVSLTMLVLYSSIIYTVRKQSHRLRESRRSRNLQAKQYNITLRMAKTCLFVVGLFFLCWIPFQIFVGIQLFGNFSENSIFAKGRTITTFIAIFNSALNPFIYAVRLPYWRRSLKMICGVKGRPVSQSGSGGINMS